LAIHLDVVERVLLDKLQRFAITSAAIDFVFAEFARQLKAAADNGGNSTDRLLTRKQQLEREMKNLTDAIRQGVSARTIKPALNDAEHELANIGRQLREHKPTSLDDQLADMRQFALQQVMDVVGLCGAKASNAKYQLMQQMSEIWMTPVRKADGERHYIGVGKWNLLSGDGLGPSLQEHIAAVSAALAKSGVRSIAGVGFEPQSVVDNT
jgi:hypothetical protein